MIDELIPYIDWYRYIQENHVTGDPFIHFRQHGFDNHLIFRFNRIPTRQLAMLYLDWEEYLLRNIQSLDPKQYRKDRIVDLYLKSAFSSENRFRKPYSIQEKLRLYFDADYYIKNYPQDKLTSSSALSHFIRYGIAENRPFQLKSPLESLDIVNNCFDGQFYAYNNDDLKGMFSYHLKGLKHFLCHGLHEGRNYRLHNLKRMIVSQSFPIPPTPSSNRACLIDLCPERTSGLVNQVYAFINAIMFGIRSNRHVYLLGFYPDYVKPYTIPCSRIFDFEEMNRRLTSYRITVNDGSLFSWDWPKANFDMKKSDNFEHCITLAQSDSRPYIYLEDGFSCFLINYYTDHDNRNLFKSLLTSIRFTTPFNQVAADVKKSLNLTEYNSVHLRLEDDLILLQQTPMSEAEYYMTRYQLYIQKIQTLFESGKAIYISTGLGKTTNKYDYLLAELEKRFPSIKFMNTKSRGIPYEGREMTAIIDFILCSEGHNFIGFGVSTFSILLGYILEAKGRRIDFVSN